MNCNIPVFVFFGVNMERVWWGGSMMGAGA